MVIRAHGFERRFDDVVDGLWWLRRNPVCGAVVYRESDGVALTKRP